MRIRHIDHQAQDAALADIENTTASIRVKLTTIRYGGDAGRDVAGLRRLLQDYVDQVMAFARDGR